MIYVGSFAGLRVSQSSSGVDAPVSVLNGDMITITAWGEIWAGVVATGTNGPAGWNWTDNDPKFPLPGSHPYALIMSIGGGPYEYVGIGRTISATRDGVITFRTNDDAPETGDPNTAFYVSADIWRPDSSDIPDCRANMPPSPTCLAQRDRAMALRADAILRCGERESANARLAQASVLLALAWGAFVFAVVAVAIAAQTAVVAASAVAALQRATTAIATSGFVSAQLGPILAGLGAASAGVQSPWLWILVAIAILLLTAAIIATQYFRVTLAERDNSEVRYQSAVRAFLDGVASVRRFCCEYPPMFDPELPRCR